MCVYLLCGQGRIAWKFIMKKHKKTQDTTTCLIISYFHSCSTGET